MGMGQGKDPFTWQPGGGTFFMTVKTPIAPVFYIEKVISWLRTVTRIHFANWTKKTKIVTKQVVFGSTL